MTDVSPQREPVDLMSPEQELARIDRTGTLWFAAALIAGAMVFCATLISGWRPADLGATARVFWWVGTAASASGLASIGYAGCPVYWGGVTTAHLQKSIAIRAGLVLLLLGSGVAVTATLAG